LWKTKNKWNNRLLVSTLSSTMVGAFKAWEHHFPPSADAAEEPDLQPRLEEFVWRATDEVCPTPTEAHPTSNGACRLELTGTRITSSGKQKGMKSAIQERCTECTMHGRTERGSNRKFAPAAGTRFMGMRVFAMPTKALAAHVEEHGRV
jgi:hypothetical protein